MLTIIIPIREIDFSLSKREFRDTIKLRYDWEIIGMPTICIHEV